ncbi:MAG TPA: hypothetical protein VF348_03765 [Usitatibacter sp.]
MKMHALISAGVAGVALATAAIPALAWTDVDVEWYVGHNMPGPAVEIAPAPREGFIWVAGRRETRGAHREWVAGHWIKDDYEEQVVAYNRGNGMATFATGPRTYEAGTTSYATGPMILRDRQGNIIPTNPSAYPIGYTGR